MENFDILKFDHILVGFSGGKDSLACILHLLEIGVSPLKIELHHHEVDGREGSNLMDWTCTPGYCKAVAKALSLPLYFSWREGGFEREMLRDNQPTASVKFETPLGQVMSTGGNSNKLGTRLKFPQVSADLSVRYCSSYLKITVMDGLIRNSSRFDSGKTLVVTGERAEESPARAKYKQLEPHRTNCNSRTVYHYRPILKWSEHEVWQIIQRWGIVPHPAYRLGWGRTSCFLCIFGSNDQWASAYKISPERVEKVAEYESRFGLTIHRTLPVMERVKLGSPYPMTESDIQSATSSTYSQPIIVSPQGWVLPQGAYGDAIGPT